MIIKNLVLSGGQLKGMAYVGVFKALEEMDKLNEIENILGVSSGAIFGFILAIGLKTQQMIKLLKGITLQDVVEINTDNIFNFMNYYGLDTGEKWCTLFKTVCRKLIGNENATFLDLKNKVPKYKLIIAAANVTNKTLDYFSVDTHPDMPLWLAIRMSISVPVYFNSVYYNNCCYVDGAILQNYPISYFDHDIKNTLGIVLTDSDIKSDVTNIGIYMYKILDCVMCTMQNYLKTKYKKNTIELFVEYNLLEFRFDHEIKDKLVNSGYKDFKENFNKKFNDDENSVNDNNSNTNESLTNESISNYNSNISSNTEEINTAESYNGNSEKLNTDTYSISDDNIDEVISDINDNFSNDDNISRIVDKL